MLKLLLSLVCMFLAIGMGVLLAFLFEKYFLIGLVAAYVPLYILDRYSQASWDRNITRIFQMKHLQKS